MKRYSSTIRKNTVKRVKSGELTVPQACASTGAHFTTIYKWLKRRRFQPILDATTRLSDAASKRRDTSGQYLAQIAVLNDKLKTAYEVIGQLTIEASTR